MTATQLWAKLWAHELDPRSERNGSIVAFIKAPIRTGMYGLTDALIATLDSSPLTHIGFLENLDVEEPLIVHSALEGVLSQPLRNAAVEHRHAPAFVFRHRTLSDLTTDSVVRHANDRVRPATDATQYPFDDLLLGAFLLRLRTDSGYDEHAHRLLASLMDQFVDVNNGGRMCAAFIAQCYQDSGVPLAPPDERAAFLDGSNDIYTSSPTMPAEVDEFVAAGLAKMAQELVANIEDHTDTKLTDLLLPAFAPIAKDLNTTKQVTHWLIAPAEQNVETPIVVANLADRLRSSGPHAATPRSLCSRFTTVHDLLRSPDIEPVGYFHNWADL